jgi:hypothetical protein
MKIKIFLLFSSVLFTIGVLSCAATLPAEGSSSPVSINTNGYPSVPSLADGSLTIQMDESAVKDKIKGGWVGQAIGVNWGAPTEFYAAYIQSVPLYKKYTTNMPLYPDYRGDLIPLELLPEWNSNMINDYAGQDDLYVEIPFMNALYSHGVNADWKALGDAYKETTFAVWHANDAGRANLDKGIYPPDSGNYKNNGHSDDIDWQIECNFIGQSCPGLVNAAKEMSWRTGHIMNYGDGVYGGVFVDAMQARAFTAQSIDDIVQAGRLAVPEGSLYRTMIEEVLDYKDQGLSWQSNWQLIQSEWLYQDTCAAWAGHSDVLNIDAKYNGMFILLGLLYGNGDISNSIVITMSCAQDSDCNPSSLGAILGTYLGFSGIPAVFTSNLNTKKMFSGLPYYYTMESAIDTNLELARQTVEMCGGSAPAGGTWTIRYQDITNDLILEQRQSAAGNPPLLDAAVEVFAGRQVGFRAAIKNPDTANTIQWFFGDLNYKAVDSCVYTYARPGTYQAVCYAADSKGNTSYKKFNLVIK